MGITWYCITVTCHGSALSKLYATYKPLRERELKTEEAGKDRVSTKAKRKDKLCCFHQRDIDPPQPINEIGLKTLVDYSCQRTNNKQQRSLFLKVD